MRKIRIGKILKTRGLKGEVKVQSFTSFAHIRFQKGKIVYLSNDLEETEGLVIDSYKEDSGHIYLTFKNYADINLVERYINYFILLPEDEQHLLDEGCFYYKDLINCQVYYLDSKVGEVIAVSENLSDHLLRVSTPKGNKLILFRKQFIEKIILDEKQIILTKLGRDLLD